ncbi:uncharacterized protein LOC108908137 isoform X1 [Anoplophora glabripennis]|uniref:uncharacterized protein LOC108908137 isoform X1 n=1 Tax=Anoplophora glabripennis TaxID=217634 RepID=UPI000873B937|nr:uncharacterized protein LOC108908137 isoform X1 [Anoplophora glabripennis]
MNFSCVQVRNHLYRYQSKQFLVFLTLISSSLGALQVIRDLIEFNVAGHPVLHKTQNWSFDPDVGKRRSRQYEELNGVLGEKAIERLGLGIDGYDRERLAKQQARDEGHLGGVDYLTP